MICATVRRRLPLWVEDDLPGPEAQAMAAHVAQCEGCGAAAEALRASQAWLKGAPEPFAESDREEVRRRVLAALQAEPARQTLRSWAPRSWALPLLAAAVVLAALALRLTRAATAPAPLQAPLAPAPLQPALVPAPLQAALVPAPPDPAPRPRRPRPPQAAAVPETAVARMEFQTSDPHIRIIWLARVQHPQPNE